MRKNKKMVLKINRMSNPKRNEKVREKKYEDKHTKTCIKLQREKSKLKHRQTKKQH